MSGREPEKPPAPMPTEPVPAEPILDLAGATPAIDVLLAGAEHQERTVQSVRIPHQ